ncbi:MAG: long-chain-acyl-CoA synthetase [Pseudomonadales bacterium]|nr:long-chain-acyl-CoA synthetase [Pseudomonadales bacterium]
MNLLLELPHMAKSVVRGVYEMRRPRDTKRSTGWVIERNTRLYPQDTAILFEGKTLNWLQFNQLVNRYSDMFKTRGITHGDSVAVMMENRIELLATAIGLNKLGAIAGLLNTNLRGEALTHCVKSVSAKKFVVGEEMLDAVDEIRAELPLANDAGDYIFVADNAETHCPDWCFNFSAIMDTFSTENPAETDHVTLNDPCFYIFTSGTTGLPKAAVMSHGRWYKAANGFGRVGSHIKHSDRFYITLPLYHNNALTLAFGSAAMVGASVYLRRKFSASQFWNDTREHNVTAFIYIGELCRYLLLQPEKPDDGDNPVVKCLGNGLRPELWMEFKNRFKIHRICEFYALSEGNSAFTNLLNKDKTFGACLSPYTVVNYDIHNDEIIFNKNGYCIPAAKGETGLLLTEITAADAYDGYTDKNASDKRVLHNVLKQGDRYFNTGDLIKQVDVGFSFGLPHYQFVDRVGDTFRWKGENVSTSEVELAVNQHPDIEYSNVYGVTVPGCDGRAGMAAIKLKSKDFNPTSFAQSIDQQLPVYARPLFIRILNEMEVTGTFKLKKGTLKEEGFDPNQVTEKVLMRMPGDQGFEPLTDQLYQQIKDQTLKF